MHHSPKPSSPTVSGMSCLSGYVSELKWRLTWASGWDEAGRPHHGGDCKGIPP